MTSYWRRLRDQQICRNFKPLAQALNHCHAQLTFSTLDFTNPAWGSEQRDKVSAGEVMLLHQIC